MVGEIFTVSYKPNTHISVILLEFPCLFRIFIAVHLICYVLLPPFLPFSLHNVTVGRNMWRNLCKRAGS